MSGPLDRFTIPCKSHLTSLHRLLFTKFPRGLQLLLSVVICLENEDYIFFYFSQLYNFLIRILNCLSFKVLKVSPALMRGKNGSQISKFLRTRRRLESESSRRKRQRLLAN